VADLPTTAWRACRKEFLIAVAADYVPSNEVEAVGLYTEFRKILNHIGLARHHVLHKSCYMSMNIPIAGVARQEDQPARHPKTPRHNGCKHVPEPPSVPRWFLPVISDAAYLQRLPGDQRHVLWDVRSART
jgi:hypothetical protein